MNYVAFIKKKKHSEPNWCQDEKNIIRAFLKSELILLRFANQEICRKMKYFSAFVADKCFLWKNSCFSTRLGNIGKFQHKYSLFFLEKEDLHVGVILNMWEIAIHLFPVRLEKKSCFQYSSFIPAYPQNKSRGGNTFDMYVLSYFCSAFNHQMGI